MRDNGKIRSTAETVIPTEITPTKVYIRTNIQQVNITEPAEQAFTGWEYDETEMETYEYLSNLQETNTQIQNALEILTQGV